MMEGLASRIRHNEAAVQSAREHVSNMSAEMMIPYYWNTKLISDKAKELRKTVIDHIGPNNINIDLDKARNAISHFVDIWREIPRKNRLWFEKTSDVSAKTLMMLRDANNAYRSIDQTEVIVERLLESSFGPGDRRNIRRAQSQQQIDRIYVTGFDEIKNEDFAQNENLRVECEQLIARKDQTFSALRHKTSLVQWKVDELAARCEAFIREAHMAQKNMARNNAVQENVAARNGEQRPRLPVNEDVDASEEMD